jgi:hypothetical protein
MSRRLHDARVVAARALASAASASIVAGAVVIDNAYDLDVGMTIRSIGGGTLGGPIALAGWQRVLPVPFGLWAPEAAERATGPATRAPRSAPLNVSRAASTRTMARTRTAGEPATGTSPRGDAHAASPGGVRTRERECRQPADRRGAARATMAARRDTR